MTNPTPSPQKLAISYWSIPIQIQSASTVLQGGSRGTMTTTQPRRRRFPPERDRRVRNFNIELLKCKANFENKLLRGEHDTGTPLTQFTHHAQQRTLGFNRFNVHHPFYTEDLQWYRESDS
ncbi:hypothetical protein TNCV_1222751 [Trichonephila clavipes]|nr:hypothetical protein TNCV_1222751 [Trichonephila clavipes]